LMVMTSTFAAAAFGAAFAATLVAGFTAIYLFLYESPPHAADATYYKKT